MLRPDDLPAPVRQVLGEFRTAEFATLARDGVPLAVPLSALWQPEQGRFLVTTGIGLPHKAYNARRHPRVSLLYSNPTGSALADPPAVLVQGDACVSEVTTWDEDMAEFWPWIFRRQPASASLALGAVYRYVVPWYYQRLKIHVIPRRVRWWPRLDMTRAPAEVAAASPADVGRAVPTTRSGSGQVAQSTTFDRLSRAVGRLPMPRLTVLDPAGYPVSTRCAATPDSRIRALRLEVPTWLHASPGPASLMSHRHDEDLWNLGGYLSRGVLAADADGWTFTPTTYAPQVGTNPVVLLGFLRSTRRAAKAHLGRLESPPAPIPWNKLAAAKKAARRG